MVRGLRTSAPCSASRRAAASCAALTRNGSPSGTEATARFAAVAAVSARGTPRSSPAPATAIAEPAASGTAALVSFPSRLSTPLAGGASRARARLRPASVSWPVATTTAVPWPAATVVPS
ncbi:hypothetical protein B0E53_04505 [Micromonospora sp. MH33]|nr:hypothetical protein B0E53_04505 [Micromonospora sp. MH33]